VTRSKSPGAFGFTLIDLAFAMAVAAVFASVLAISMIGRTDKDKAEIAARQTLAILDAARWIQARNQWGHAFTGVAGDASDTPLFEIQTDPATGAISGHRMSYATPGLWPGQKRSYAGNAYKCKGMIDYGLAIADLQKNVQSGANRGAFLPNGVTLQNPWGEVYEFSLDSPNPSDGNINTGPAMETLPDGRTVNIEVNCWFRVSTNVPVDVRNNYRSVLPNAFCDEPESVGTVCPVGTQAVTRPGFTRCCTMIPRPGLEPRFMDWLRISGDRTIDYPSLWCAPWLKSVDSDKDCSTPEAQ
jgi:type II secretory pathway pseudopilin PulG